MECTSTWPGDREYLEVFNRKVMELRVPLSGSIDFTQRCNLRCVHCYVGPQLPGPQEGSEMETQDILRILDEIADEGCLYLLITGGEPLLRRDFEEIYSRAKLKGFLVTVFTNGTLITDRLVELFDDLPPQTVEISLYGVSPMTYERITGVPGSYEKCIRAIEGLLGRGINVKLKTILMTLNRHEFFEMQEMANRYGVPFRFDAAIFPRLNGDKMPLRFRVAPEEVVEKEFSDDERIRGWEDFVDRYKALPESESLYTCGAGLSSFHIDPWGNLKPCLMTPFPRFSLLKGSFSTGWRDAMPRIRERKAGDGFFCTTCEKRLLCGFCPAFFALENGREDIRSEYLCSTGRQRYQRITDRKGGSNGTRRKKERAEEKI